MVMSWHDDSTLRKHCMGDVIIALTASLISILMAIQYDNKSRLLISNRDERLVLQTYAD